MNYKEILEENFKENQYFFDNKIVYVGEIIFDFTTYDKNVTMLFANKMLDVIKSIINRTTFEFIKSSDENYLLLPHYCQYDVVRCGFLEVKNNGLSDLKKLT